MRRIAIMAGLLSAAVLAVSPGVAGKPGCGGNRAHAELAQRFSCLSRPDRHELSSSYGYDRFRVPECKRGTYVPRICPDLPTHGIGGAGRAQAAFIAQEEQLWKVLRTVSLW